MFQEQIRCYGFPDSDSEYYFVADAVNDFIVLFGNEIFESQC